VFIWNKKLLNMVINVVPRSIIGIYRTSLTLKLSDNDLLLSDNDYNRFWSVQNYRHDEIHPGYAGQTKNSNFMAIIILIMANHLFELRVAWVSSAWSAQIPWWCTWDEELRRRSAVTATVWPITKILLTLENCFAENDEIPAMTKFRCRQFRLNEWK